MKRDLSKKELEELERITRMVTGALKDTINAHGPITKTLIPSAAKRISNQLFVALHEESPGQPQPNGDPLDA